MAGKISWSLTLVALLCAIGCVRRKSEIEQSKQFNRSRNSRNNSSGSYHAGRKHDGREWWWSNYNREQRDSFSLHISHADSSRGESAGKNIAGKAVFSMS